MRPAMEDAIGNEAASDGKEDDMNSSYAKYAGGSVGVLMLISLLTSCGTKTAPTAARHHHHTQHHSTVPRTPQSVSASPSTPPTYTPKSTSIPVAGANFPAIITMAMRNVSGLVATSVEAPTMIPWPANGSTTLFYAPAVSGNGSGIPGLIDSYQVTLSSPPVPVAQFGSAIFSSTQYAAQQVDRMVSKAGLTYPGPGPSVDLGDGIDAVAALQHHVNVLAWSQGSWSVVVGDARQVPLHTAKQVVSYLSRHYMPDPAGSGVAVIVVMVGKTGIRTSVGWQEGRWVYTTATFPTTAQPITTALALALSMRRYPT